VSLSVDRLTTALSDRYRIERPLGSGGMATVHLAHDLRHDRKVALKVLKPELAAVIGVERFLNEIRVTANLQHPHILPLYESGSLDGMLFYVMPYIEGETLADRLRREKQLSIEDAVRIASETAAALDYAHRHNVVHRDIKPANILLQDGGVLVADFGIALALRAAGGDRITETGLSLGTPHYMSPEQATGDRDIDLRSDIYALGAVLYEMLAGEPPHSGSTAQAIIARVLTETPRPVASLRPSVPGHVADAVEIALSRIPADRFASAAQFAQALRDPSVGRTRARAAIAAPARSRGRALVWPGVAAVAVAVAAWSATRPPAAAAVSWYEMSLPEHRPTTNNLPSFELTPDGNRIVYVGVGERGSGFQLWVRERDQLKATAIRGTQGAQTLTLSPDGRSVAFIATPARLRVVPIAGGVATEVAANVWSAFGISWGDDGNIYLGYGGTVMRVAARGGEMTRIDSLWPDGARARVQWLQVLPGGRSLLATTSDSSGPMIVTLDIATGRRTAIAPGAYARYASSGRVFIISAQGAVTTGPIDGSGRLKGALVPLLDGVAMRPSGFADFAVGGQRLAYRIGAGDEASDEAVWVGRDGGVTSIDREWRFSSSGNSGWALSPDGTKLAIKLNSAQGGVIWVRDLKSNSLRRVTFDEGNSYRPRWSPDGVHVTYVASRSSRLALYRRRADGTGSEEPILRLDHQIGEGRISPDGRYVMGRTLAGGVGLSQLPAERDIWARRTTGDTTPFALVQGPAEERAFSVSPDNRWFVYVSDETGVNEVYVRPFPDVNGGKWQISTGGGAAPLWNPRGRELFYVDAANQMTAIDLSRGPAEPGARRTLFSLEGYRQSTNYTWFDVDPSGEKFVMVREANAGGMAIIENYSELFSRQTTRR
jgi:serine/threonine-protein kinase